MRTIPKENTTLGCHESFLSENRTVTKGKDPLIGDVGKLLIGGQTGPTTNGSGNGPPGGGPLGGGGSGLPRGGSNGPLGDGGSKHPIDQNPISYDVGLARAWIGPTQNRWYSSW